jgi:hypothetical protein
MSDVPAAMKVFSIAAGLPAFVSAKVTGPRRAIARVVTRVAAEPGDPCSAQSGMKALG